MNRITFPRGTRYTLSRDRDGAGDSGLFLVAYDWNSRKEVEANCLIIGMGVKCGAHYARSYVGQDWWLTTPIKEFTKITEKEVKFITENGSHYTLKVT